MATRRSGYEAVAPILFKRELMAKDTDPFELNAAGKQAMELALQAVDTYFDFLKKSVWSFPSGGTQLGEKLRDQAIENINAVHELVGSSERF